MKRVNIYLLRQWWRSLLLVLLVILTIFFILTLSEELGGRDASIGQGLTITFLHLPLFIMQIMPGCCLIGSVLCLILLDRTHELTVMRNIGMGYFKILGTLLLGGVLPLTAAMALNNEWLTPLTQAVVADQRQGDDTGTHSSSFFADRDNLWFTWRDVHVHAGYVDADGLMSDITLFQYKDDGTLPSLQSITEARKGVPDQGETWLLQDTRQIRLAREEAERQTTEEAETHWSLPHTASTLADIRVPAKALPAPVLIHRAFYGTDPLMMLIHITSLGYRLLQPLLLALMVTLAIPLASLPRSAGSRILLASLMTIIWHTQNQLIQYIGITRQWPAWLTISTPLAILSVITVLAVFLIMKTKKLQ